MTGEASTMLAPLAMIGFALLALVYDFWLPRTRAVLATLLTGFLLLPSVEYDLAGVLLWNRITAPVLMVWVGILARDRALLRRFRLRVWDLPILLWCAAPAFSSLSNGLGFYDAVAACFYQSVQWAGPYFIGRLHFRERAHAFELARMLALGCLLYLPLCAFEILFSPQLHLRLYGFHQHLFYQSIRGAFYRPVVFLQHGLMVAMWLAAGAIMAWSLHRARGAQRVLGLPAGLVAAGGAAVLLASQSAGASALFALAAGAWWISQRLASRLPLLLLCLLPAAWAGARMSGLIETGAAADAVARFSAERAESLAFRMTTEDELIAHSRERPLLGWSSWGRDRVIETNYYEQTLIVDGLWIFALSQNGYFGLIALLAAHAVPILLFLGRFRPRDWRADSGLMLLLGLAFLLAVTMIDHLLNAMVTPYAILVLGALPTLARGWRLEAGTATDPDARDRREAEHPAPRVLGG